MTFFPPSRPRLLALPAIAALHVLLVGALLAQRVPPPVAPDAGPRAGIQWLLPAIRPERDTPAPPPDAASRPVTRARPEAAATPDEPAATAAAGPAAPVPASTAEADPFGLPTAPSAPDATAARLRRHDWGAGKADHELRGGKLSKLVRPTDTLQAGLERAFQVAGEAVPPRWFERADIREVSTPDSRMRMYKVRTAFGTYCFYLPDPGRQADYKYALMTCPREK